MNLIFKVVESTSVNQSLHRIVFEGDNKGEAVRFLLHIHEDLPLGTSFEAVVGAPAEPKPVEPAESEPAPEAEPAPATKGSKKKGK